MFQKMPLFVKVLIFFIAIIFDGLIIAGLPPTTLSGQSQSTKPTTFNFKTPYNQSTQVSGINSLIETGNDNLLANPNFEGTASGGVAYAWTNSAGTASLTTTAGQFSSGLQAQKIVLATQSLSFFQSQSTPSGIVKTGVAGISYRVPASASTFQICSLVDGAEQTCLASSTLLLDDAFHAAEVPVTFGSSTAGIKVKASSSVATIYLDNAYVMVDTSARLRTASFSANTSTTAGTTSTPFVFTVENHDPLNMYNNATGVATIPAGYGGKWVCSFSAYSSSSLAARLHKNGTNIYEGSSVVSGASATLGATPPITLAAGDTLEIRPSASATASSGATLNTFGCWKVAD